MRFNAEIDTYKGLYGYFFKFITSEFRKIVMEENPDLWKFIVDNHIGLSVLERYTAEMISDDIRRHKGHLRKDQMQTMLMNWRDKEESSGFQMRAEWVFANDKMKICRYFLEVSAPNLCMQICENIYDLDCLKDEILWELRHEVGHMIDYMHTHNNISFQEWKAQEDDIVREYDKYFEDTRGPSVSPEQRDEYNIRYYKIPREQAANDAVGISVKEMIVRDHVYDKKYSGKLVTITIDQTGIRERPQEEENKNEQSNS